MKRKITPMNIEKVVKNLLYYLKGDDQVIKKVFCKHFNVFLDGLVEIDFFGTEAQSDPRGDQRN